MILPDVWLCRLYRNVLCQRHPFLFVYNRAVTKINIQFIALLYRLKYVCLNVHTVFIRIVELLYMLFFIEQCLNVLNMKACLSLLSRERFDRILLKCFNVATMQHCIFLFAMQYNFNFFRTIIIHAIWYFSDNFSEYIHCTNVR